MKDLGYRIQDLDNLNKIPEILTTMKLIEQTLKDKVVPDLALHSKTLYGNDNRGGLSKDFLDIQYAISMHIKNHKIWYGVIITFLTISVSIIALILKFLN